MPTRASAHVARMVVGMDACLMVSFDDYHPVGNFTLPSSIAFWRLQAWPDPRPFMDFIIARQWVES